MTNIKNLDSTAIYAWTTLISVLICVPGALIFEGATLRKGVEAAIAAKGAQTFYTSLLSVGLLYHLYNQVRQPSTAYICFGCLRPSWAFYVLRAWLSWIRERYHIPTSLYPTLHTPSTLSYALLVRHAAVPSTVTPGAMKLFTCFFLITRLGA